MTKRRILVTSALPYANGEIHLGHLLEYIQTDIWVRFQKMQGNECHYVCADDAHGTPIMLKANEMGIDPEELIADVSQRHQADFKDFNIEFSQFHSTHSDENQYFSELIYSRLKESGFIKTRVISQAFDPEKEMFLPDRFIKGECPKCGADDQYGDNCEVCGATYSTTELKMQGQLSLVLYLLRRTLNTTSLICLNLSNSSKTGLTQDTFKMRLAINWPNGLIKDFSSGIYQEISRILASRYREQRTNTSMYG